MLRELPWREPSEVFAVWAHDAFVAWLDSGGPASARSRFSYVAVSPFQVLTAGGGDVADPFAVLAAELAGFRRPPVEDEDPIPVPFCGGAVGFIGYEAACRLERVPRVAEGRLDVPDMAFGFYDLVFAFDLLERRCWLVSTGLPERAIAARRHRARERSGWALDRLDDAPVSPSPVPPLVWRRETARPSYEARVRRILRHIADGDIYQANLTCRFLADAPGGVHAADIHAALRRDNPAPFGAYLGCGERLAIASASPERFISMTADGLIESRPIKGTRARGDTAGEDRRLLAELAGSAKDRAENLMIVDLLRNDIGRVAEIGSVRVPGLWSVETFAAAHHLVSSIEGRLRPGLGPVDLLRATFPGGSITGAPKIRAMQIIADVEGVARGPYCGCIAWIGFDGAMDSSIVIRTAVVTPEVVMVQAGGGIVADSDPASEFEEMMVKARPLLRALGTEPA